MALQFALIEELSPDEELIPLKANMMHVAVNNSKSDSGVGRILCK